MSMNNLFATEARTESTNARQLNGTAQLTAISAQYASGMINEMEANIDDYREKLQASTKDMNLLDALIEELVDVPAVETEFLKEIDDETIEGMLKSQQSKRSRTKSKVMTLDNYKNLVTAAIAEHIIRDVCNKPKMHGGPRRAGKVDYTPAELEFYEANQDELKKEIRNIQSKKSIMKSKEGFDETDERWLALLKAEQMLKDLRVGGATTVVEVDTTKNSLIELMEDVVIDELKADEAVDLLKAIEELLQ